MHSASLVGRLRVNSLEEIIMKLVNASVIGWAVSLAATLSCLACSKVTSDEASLQAATPASTFLSGQSLISGRPAGVCSMQSFKDSCGGVTKIVIKGYATGVEQPGIDENQYTFDIARGDNIVLQGIGAAHDGLTTIAVSNIVDSLGLQHDIEFVLVEQFTDADAGINRTEKIECINLK